MKPVVRQFVTVIEGWGAWDSKGKYRGGQRTVRRSLPKLLRDMKAQMDLCKNHPLPEMIVVPDWMAQLIKDKANAGGQARAASARRLQPLVVPDSEQPGGQKKDDFPC